MRFLQPSLGCDLFPANASCKCYFFDNLGEFSGRRIGEASEPRFNDALRRRFLKIGVFLMLLFVFISLVI